jgi:serine/threonine-protein kinase
LPHAFDSMMSKALAKTPDNRYDSCAEFIALITRALR